MCERDYWGLDEVECENVELLEQVGPGPVEVGGKPA